MNKAILAALALAILLFAETCFASGQPQFTVVPFESDPNGSHLVSSEWKSGTGCPTNATTFDGNAFASYTDPSCSTADPRDRLTRGLVLAKTGPSSNQAHAGANINGVQGLVVYEVGYDLRKPDGTSSARGSHCGQLGPYFHIVASDGTTRDIPCMDVVPELAAQATASTPFWQRLRWSLGGITVKQISILFRDGQDVGPDNFGLAVLDNIDINGTLIGRGPRTWADGDEGGGQDGNQNEFDFQDSPSHPDSSSMEYHDRSTRMNLQSVNGVGTITHNAGCVSLAGDALVNLKTGYTYTFTACDLSALGTGIGNFTITIAGPLGFLYQKSAVMISGYVQINGQ
jgi:hypothetical protein